MARSGDGIPTLQPLYAERNETPGGVQGVSGQVGPTARDEWTPTSVDQPCLIFTTNDALPESEFRSR
jgi:hypothetical protein